MFLNHNIKGSLVNKKNGYTVIFFKKYSSTIGVVVAENHP